MSHGANLHLSLCPCFTTGTPSMHPVKNQDKTRFCMASVCAVPWHSNSSFSCVFSHERNFRVYCLPSEHGTLPKTIRENANGQKLLLRPPRYKSVNRDSEPSSFPRVRSARRLQNTPEQCPKNQKKTKTKGFDIEAYIYLLVVFCSRVKCCAHR